MSHVHRLIKSTYGNTFENDSDTDCIFYRLDN